MSERNMRKRVVQWLSDLDAFAVENPAHPGTADVNYIEGWVELKQLKAWPKRASTPVRIEHYTSQQRIRARKRWNKGGNIFWLLQVKNEWLLLDGNVAAALYDGGAAPTRAELYERARMTWTNQKTLQNELCNYLCRPRNSARDRGW